MENHIKRLIVSGISFDWREVSGTVPKGLILGPVLFNFLKNNHMDKGVEGLLMKFADYTKLGRVVEAEFNEV